MQIKTTVFLAGAKENMANIHSKNILKIIVVVLVLFLIFGSISTFILRLLCAQYGRKQMCDYGLS